MEPATIALLVIRFASSFADRAGSRSADLVFDYLERRPSAGNNPAEAIEASVKIEPGFGELVTDAINGDILSFTVDAAKVVYSEPFLLQSFLGISNSHARFAFRGKCPIGGEFLIIPPSYLRPDGTRITGMTLLSYPSLRRESPLARGRCRNGHEWLVFPVAAG
jgi:hypothetical protein